MHNRRRRRMQQKGLLAVLTGVGGLFGLVLSGPPSAAVGARTVSTSGIGLVSASRVTASSGCAEANSHVSPTAPSTNTTVPFEAAGESGSYLINDLGTRMTHPLPLVLDLHAYSETALAADLVTGLGAYGDAHGFITVTPQVQQTVPHWVDTPGSADRAFVVALIDHIEASECVDLRRVYMVGYSNGAFMTSSLVCELGGRLAAVATVAGIQAPAHCLPKRPVPVIAFHGTADPLVPYRGGGLTPAAKALAGPDGTGTFGSLLHTRSIDGIIPLPASIPTELGRWADRNHCSSRPIVSKAARGVQLIAYQCPDHGTVELYREEGDGHTWPGSAFTNLPAIRAALGPTTFAINADQLMWAFFQSHPLPR